MKKSKIFALIIACFASYSCNKLMFFDKPFQNTLLCDTIYSDDFNGGKKILYIFQNIADKKVSHLGITYYQYRLSPAEDSEPILLSFRDNRIYITPFDVFLKDTKFEEELLIDFSAKAGSVWDVYGGGLLGNSRFRLDSINEQQEIYYLSSSRLIDISDELAAYKLAISKSAGVTEIFVTFLGDSTSCRCR
ncbi:MAG TPA: hypothetical protein PK325_08520 [Cyclobacteriaceae bacterium]|nr:hypothetical protein [Cyclobacteriaceae bacterium]HMV09135.1 hypothetical protein [Cyclobacteriaceae bacterium]HMX01496.1 hypothetical protein [Cyclobacteriaceae bacterium]HMX50234.1 hypothetical protein [Cyclobacteriaceae bacterium]HMY92302.1 hypothetical protein [Cyclobacteriaceae bacterium]